jgi:hypothetical protein
MMDPAPDAAAERVSEALAGISIEGKSGIEEKYSSSPPDPSSSDNIGRGRHGLVVPYPSSLPVTRTRSLKLMDEIPTDVLLQVFCDRVVFCVSQVWGGRVGHWFLCERRPDLVRPGGWDFATTALLGAQKDGADATEGLVYAQQLCQELALLSAPASSSSSAASSTHASAAAPGTPAAPSLHVMKHPTVILGISLHPSAKGRPEAFRSLIQALVAFYQESVSMTVS